VQVHEQFAGGATRVLYVDENPYVMQREGQWTQRGLVFVLNNSGQWNGTSVQTKWNNTRFAPQAWRGHNDPSVPLEKWTNDSGWGAFWARLRGLRTAVTRTVNRFRGGLEKRNRS
jgi:hypothetical protein